MLSAIDILNQRDTYGVITGAERVFGRGYFCYSIPVLEPRHIRQMPKRVSFWLRVLPETENSFYASVLLRTEAISLYYCLVSDATEA